jgi:hypothetical protein
MLSCCPIGYMRAVFSLMYACTMKSTLKTDLEILQLIQARAARVFCGVFQAASRAVLDVEAYLLFFEYHIWKCDADAIT